MQSSIATIWIFITQFSFSALLVLSLYHLYSENSSQTQSHLATQAVLAQTSTPLESQILQKGNVISLNGRKFAVAWSQWQEGNLTHIGMSDTGAQQILGLDLLSTQNPAIQPIAWFNSTLNLPTKFINPYRYLDVTTILQQAGAEVEIINNTLAINFPLAKIQNLSIESYGSVQRLILELDRPTFWQVNQAKNEGVITIEGIADPDLISRFQPLPEKTDNLLDEDEDDLGSSTNVNPESQLVSLENGGTTTQLKINLPTTYGLQIASITNSYRLIIDIHPQTLKQKEIVWQSGITWRQKYIKIQQNWFPVTWLEIDLQKTNITLKPITTNSETQKGTAPLVKTATATEAVAAINGGFFNRKNQLPLGAIRADSRWLSSPILNRGAIAWNNQGQFKISRLKFQEILTTSNGDRFSLLYLNSGYLEPGIARYTREWGTSYTPLTDKETLIMVQNNQVVAQYQAKEAGQDTIPIPSDGYLLTLRKDNTPSRALTTGTKVKLESLTIPPEFNNYPQILGAGPVLLENGRIVLDAAAEKFSKAFEGQKASRSAIATTRQGKLILVAVHHRVKGQGATLAEFAQIMQHLGAINALNLDGGSSTSLVLGGHLLDRSPTTAASVHNGIGIFLSP